MLSFEKRGGKVDLQQLLETFLTEDQRDISVRAEEKAERFHLIYIVFIISIYLFIFFQVLIFIFNHSLHDLVIQSQK